MTSGADLEEVQTSLGLSTQGGALPLGAALGGLGGLGWEQLWQVTDSLKPKEDMIAQLHV